MALDRRSPRRSGFGGDSVMDPALKAEWVKRLRSGNYSQTPGVLHDEKGYCCLGVLSEMAVEAGIVVASQLKKGGRWYYHRPDTPALSGNGSVLHIDVLTWADMHDPDPNVVCDYPNGFGRCDSTPLSHLNDNGIDFNKIADIIEQNDTL